MLVSVSVASALVAAVASAAPPERAKKPPRRPRAPSARGESLYQAHCARCHGVAGRGNGPDAVLFLPPPRDLREGFLDRYSTDELVRRVREGEPLRLTIDPQALHARAGQVDAIVAHLERLPSIDWHLVERGEEIYVDRCEICHGPFGRGPVEARGVAKTPRDLSDPSFQHRTSDREIVQVVQHGRREMPAIPGLHGRDDFQALIAFVRVLSPGYELYSRHCAGCHGDDGRGAGSFAEAKPLPPTVFDRRYLRETDPEELRQKVWHMFDAQQPQMPHFRTELSQPDARAIIDYLRARN